MSGLRRFFRWLAGDAPRVQHCEVYCPCCRYELVAGGQYVGEHDGLEHYVCNTCSEVSAWDFGPPAPLLIRRTSVAWWRPDPEVSP